MNGFQEVRIFQRYAQDVNRMNGINQGRLKMNEFKPRAPDFASDSIAIWKAEDKNGKVFLKVSVFGGKAINCFKVEPKEEKKEGF